MVKLTQGIRSAFYFEYKALGIFFCKWTVDDIEKPFMLPNSHGGKKMKINPRTRNLFFTRNRGSGLIPHSRTNIVAFQWFSQLPFYPNGVDSRTRNLFARNRGSRLIPYSRTNIVTSNDFHNFYSIPMELGSSFRHYHPCGLGLFDGEEI